MTPPPPAPPPPAPPPARSPWLTAGIVFALVVVAIGGVLAWRSWTQRGDVGRFDYDPDVVRFVDTVVEDVFRRPTPDRVRAVMVEEAARSGDLEGTVGRLADRVGGVVGPYEIVDHRILSDVELTIGTGRYDVAEVDLDVEYTHGPGQLFLSVIDDGGELRVLGWNMTLGVAEDSR